MRLRTEITGALQPGLNFSGQSFCRSCSGWKLLRAFYTVAIPKPACWAGCGCDAIPETMCIRPITLSLSGGKRRCCRKRISGGRPQCNLPLAGSFGEPFLRVFPCFPSVTRSVLFLRPAGAARLCFSGSFHNKSPAHTTRGFGPGGRDFLRFLPKKRRLPLGAGPLASLRAWVSRVTFGQKQIRRK
jgi:hypothetical protein